jgi:peptide-methionine (R)-S-oxide reductase
MHDENSRETRTGAWSRRTFLLSAAGACVGAAMMKDARSGSLAGPKLGPTVKIENFSAAGVSVGVTEIARVAKTDAEWRAQLSPASYEITRREGTERAGSGQYANNHASGLYRCICCDTALFDSKTKFESGTGWPSFWQPISRLNVAEITDSSFGMRRVAVACSRCDAHLGHVFDDGPRPTGLRYCMNSVALRFVAREG